MFCSKFDRSPRHFRINSPREALRSFKNTPGCKSRLLVHGRCSGTLLCCFTGITSKHQNSYQKLQQREQKKRGCWKRTSLHAMSSALCCHNLTSFASRLTWPISPHQSWHWPDMHFHLAPMWSLTPRKNRFCACVEATVVFCQQLDNFDFMLWPKRFQCWKSVFNLASWWINATHLLLCQALMHAWKMTYLRGQPLNLQTWDTANSIWSSVRDT